MKLLYDRSTDSLYIQLAERDAADSREVESGVVLDFDATGHLVGIDIAHASKIITLDRVVLKALPAPDVAIE